VAINPESYDCLAADGSANMSFCKTCTWPPPPEGDDGQENCSAVEPHDLVYVSEYGPVSGVQAMKKEIFKNGPIGCGIQSTNGFHAYTGGVYEEFIMYPQINHEIAVVGWGVSDDGTEYWIGRNSWGTYWGDNGFFYLRMYKNNLGIETDCDWGIPTYTKP
jgi:cathepsin X